MKLILAKDRHGHIPGQVGSTVALVTIAPEDDGDRVTVTLDPPDRVDQAGTFRPTVLMERLSRALEDHPGLSKRAIRATVKGKATFVDTALELLIAEQFVAVEADGQARLHRASRPYREAEDPNRVPVSRPCPDRVPDTGVGDRVPVSPPIGTRDTGHGPPKPFDRVPARDESSSEKIR